MRVLWIAVVAGCGFQSQPVALDATSLADTGVPIAPDAKPDAEPGAAFDYAQCPADYRADLLPGPSRYRVLRDGHRAWEQSDTCNVDLPGATHLVILETAVELASVAAYLDQTTEGIANNSLWIGGVQRRTAIRPRDSWIGFDGARLLDIWNNNEPNDDGGLGADEGDHKEQFAMIEHNHNALADAAGGISSGALCECDGRRLGADVIVTIDDNRLPN